MGVLSKTRKFLAKMIEYSYSAGQMVGEIKKDKDPRRIAKYSKIELSSAQKEAIDAVYSSSYGKAIRYDWHKYYQSFTGNFDSRYFAEYLLSTKLEPVMNPTDYRDTFRYTNIRCSNFSTRIKWDLYFSRSKNWKRMCHFSTSYDWLKYIGR